MIIVAQQQQVSARAAAAEQAALAGSCAVVLKVLDSALPPPFPTKQPARLYIGNLVVRESMRRKGCGTALLTAVETLGALPHQSPTPLLRMLAVNSAFVTCASERDLPPYNRTCRMHGLMQPAASPGIAPVRIACRRCAQLHACVGSSTATSCAGVASECGLRHAVLQKASACRAAMAAQGGVATRGRRQRRGGGDVPQGGLHHGKT